LDALWVVYLWVVWVLVMEILVGAWDEVVFAVEVLGEKVDLSV